MSKLAPDTKEIIRLLSQLKAETPEYPADLLAVRKAAFIKKLAALSTQGNGPGGEQGGGTSGSGTSLGGSTTAPGIILQVLVGFGLVAAMLIGSYILRDPVNGLLKETMVSAAAQEEAIDPTLVPVTGAIATPIGTILPTATVPPTSTPGVTTTPAGSNPAVESETEGNPLNSTDNPGLQLGKTPGTPAAPGQGNPGNINQPDKPDKPEKPDKPGKSNQ